jgi:hypothetical protein
MSSGFAETSILTWFVDPAFLSQNQFANCLIGWRVSILAQDMQP